MKIHPSLKTRGQTSPCRTPPVTTSHMAAKNKMANQTKGSSPTRKPWAQATRKGRSQTSPKTIMRWLGQSHPRSLKDRNVNKSSKELVSA